jgi:hypothetical protein
MIYPRFGTITVETSLPYQSQIEDEPLFFSFLSILFINHLAVLFTQGYSSSSKDHKGTFLDDWDLSEANRSEVTEVNSFI